MIEVVCVAFDANRTHRHRIRLMLSLWWCCCCCCYFWWMILASATLHRSCWVVVVAWMEGANGRCIKGVVWCRWLCECDGNRNLSTTFEFEQIWWTLNVTSPWKQHKFSCTEASLLEVLYCLLVRTMPVLGRTSFRRRIRFQWWPGQPTSSKWKFVLGIGKGFILIQLQFPPNPNNICYQGS